MCFFPKPTLTFYLYNKPEILYKRKKEHTIEELKRQMKLFDYLQKNFKAEKIKTDNISRNTKEISEIAFKRLLDMGY